MLGAILFLYFFLKRLADSTAVQDGLAVGLYCICVVVCFILSTVFHIFSDHSPEMHKFGNELDHLGIVLVMWGTGVSGTHFAFHCNNTIRVIYFSLLSAAAVACGLFTLQPSFRQPAYRTMRFSIYVSLGAGLLAPLAHGIYAFGWTDLDEMMGLESFLSLSIINFCGVAVYAARIPERWFPGRFDHLGQSHNWMHLLVLIGAQVRLRGLLIAANKWHGRIIPSAPEAR